MIPSKVDQFGAVSCRAWFFYVIAAFLIAGCASAPLPYPNEYPLTSEPFLSRDKTFTGRIPQGWYAPSEDSLASSYLAWVVKEDLSASIGFTELHLDPLTAARVQKEGLELLATISATYQKETGHTMTVDIPPKEFKMRNRQYCGYELTGAGERRRIVVYIAAGRYYECSAVTLTQKFTPQDVKDLYSAQQTMLYSLTF